MIQSRPALNNSADAPALGSTSWSLKLAQSCLRNCRKHLREALAFIAAGSLAVLINYTAEYPGGVILAIPVLFMPLVPHTLRLAAQRGLAATIACLGSYALIAVFHEQPWVLMLVMVFTVVVGAYLLQHGLDVLTWMLCVAVPAITFLDGIGGQPLGGGLLENYNRLLIGLLCAEFISILFLRTNTEPLLRERLATIFDQLAVATGTPPESRSRADLPGWSTTSTSGLENMIRRVRVENGRRNPGCENLQRLAEATALMAGACQIWTIEPTFSWNETWTRDFGDLPDRLRSLTARQLVELADATRDRRPARPVPGLRQALLDARTATEQCLRAVSNESEIEKARLLAHQQMRLQIMNQVIREMLPWTGQEPSRDSQRLPIPGPEQLFGRSFFSTALQVLGTPDKWDMLFALKAGLTGALALTIASVYPLWGGAMVLVLTALLLSVINMGAVNNSLIQRIIGLVGGLVGCLLGILIFFPVIDGPWSFLLLLGFILFPAAIMMQVPALVGIGVSWAMTVMFTFTGMVHPAASLVTVQQRLVSVIGATLLSWLVFLIVRPVYARERLDDSMAQIFRVLSSLSGLMTPRIQRNSFTLESHARTRVRKAILQAANLFHDVQFERNRTIDYLRSTKVLLDHLERLFLIQRDLIRLYGFAHLMGSDIGPLEVQMQGATARSQAMLAMADLLGDTPERIEPLLDRAVQSVRDFDASVNDLVLRDSPPDTPLAPLVAIKVPLQMLVEQLERIHEELVARRSVLEGLTPIPLSGAAPLP